MRPNSVRYTVSMLRANAHYFDVTMEVAVPGSERELRLAMPVWTPGHYVVDDFARNVGDVKAVDVESGKELDVRKTQKSSWTVRTEGTTRVRVEYSVYSFAYAVGTSYIDGEHALINGASVFLYLKGKEGSPVKLKLVPRPAWKRVATGLERVSDWEFEAPDYDRLVDSPLEVGNQEVSSFEVGKTMYEVSMFGPSVGDRKRFVGDLRRIVEATIPVFSQVPFRRYVFLVNFTDSGRGGLEHLNSTMCFLQRFRMMPREEYNLAMGLFSHEFFHAWNVKRMRPRGLGPFEYLTETYTKSLWIAEGITSYYDDLIVRRAGLSSVGEYLGAFADNINQIKSLPGSRHQSAEEASFDTWTKYYKPNENSANVTSSYYFQGAVIGWMLDMVIRNGGKGTLDEVMRRVYTSTYMKEGRGYTDDEFEEACVVLGGREVREVFDSRVRGREEVDFDRYLGYAGLRLTVGGKQAEQKGFLGVKLSSESGRVLVKECLAGSPAEAMGLAVNDELIALDGLRVGQDRLAFYVGGARPDRSVVLTVARNGKMTEVQGKVGARPMFEWRIEPLARAGSRQKALFKGWMLAEWKPELKLPEYVRSPDRKPAFDYV